MPYNDSPDPTESSTLRRYHELSKHRLDRYAPGPGWLDWANQPEPFRHFAGARRTVLPLVADTLQTRFNAIRRGNLPAARAFDLDSVATLLELSLGLSAWKALGGNRWALRCNPSSGNLHPTEGYLLCPALPGLPAGVHHYVSRDHALERRAAPDDPRWDAAFGAGVLVGLSSIHWREAWKYGMRAWRYCQHDCGHALAAVSYAAAALGWQARLVSAASDEDVASLLGLDRAADFAAAEREVPDALLWIAARVASPPPLVAMRESLQAAAWFGKANCLSREHRDWPDIDAVAGATVKPLTPTPIGSVGRPLPLPADPALDFAFARLARQRRSAVDFDGTTHISATAFLTMLDTLHPRDHIPPWNTLDTEPRVHAALFVHRVTGLEPGLYLLLRKGSALAELQAAMRSEWLWRRVGPDYLDLFLLLPYDLRDVAKTICCHQDIAADGCFAMAMLAPMHAADAEPWRYRYLFWECGMLGHVLYLEAEMAGVRSTGIGCYFDDELHDLLGLPDNQRWQSLYHFSMGGPVDDPRLSTLPPYPGRRHM